MMEIFIIFYFFGCKDAAQQVLMSVCPCVRHQVEILPSYSIQCNSVQFHECSRMFKNVLECLRMFQIVPEC